MFQKYHRVDQSAWLLPSFLRGTHRAVRAALRSTVNTAWETGQWTWPECDLIDPRSQDLPILISSGKGLFRKGVVAWRPYCLTSLFWDRLWACDSPSPSHFHAYHRLLTNGLSSDWFALSLLSFEDDFSLRVGMNTLSGQEMLDYWKQYFCKLVPLLPKLHGISESFIYSARLVGFNEKGTRERWIDNILFLAYQCGWCQGGQMSVNDRLIQVRGDLLEALLEDGYAMLSGGEIVPVLEE